MLSGQPAQKNLQLPEKKLIFKILQRLQVQMSGETEVEKSACELDDRETSPSSSKKINYYSLG